MISSLRPDKAWFSGAVSLTADGGAVDIAGTIDVSGINGGQVGLYGVQGVTLESSARILARASGYGPFDTRQAKGGDVTLGTAGSGSLTIASGALIDVSALNTQPRIVEGEENGVTTYNYVAGDTGGTVTLRVPVSGARRRRDRQCHGRQWQQHSGRQQHRARRLSRLRPCRRRCERRVLGRERDGQRRDHQHHRHDGGLPNFLADEAAGTIPTFIQDFNARHPTARSEALPRKPTSMPPRRGAGLQR